MKQQLAGAGAGGEGGGAGGPNSPQVKSTAAAATMAGTLGQGFRNSCHFFASCGRRQPHVLLVKFLT